MILYIRLNTFIELLTEVSSLNEMWSPNNKPNQQLKV